MAPLETLTSPRWPEITAQIHFERHHGAKPVIRVKIASKEFPALATNRVFSTKEDAVAYARTVLGFEIGEA